MRYNLRYLHFSFLLFLSFLPGCSLGPSYKPPCIDVPAGWKNENDCNWQTSQSDGEKEYLDFWWEVFEDGKLNSLERMALENNRDLYIAFERVQEYRALMGMAAADFYPQINLNPVYSNLGELLKIYANPANVDNLANINRLYRAHELLYMLPFTFDYEVDLWGKIRDQYAAAKYNWLASEKGYETLMLTLTSSLASAYFQMRAADAQIELLSNVLKTRQKAYEINQARYEGQITFYSAVALAGEEVQNVLLQYNETVRQRKVLENQIAILIGTPASDFSLEAMPLREQPPCIPEGIPSEVLLRRPDIAEAEFIMRSSHAMVKQAYTQFFPSLHLTAVGGYESPVLKEFLKWLSRYWMLGADIHQVVFDGFKTMYNLQAQMARFQETSGEYQQAALKAFQEVEDALTNISSYAKEYANAAAAAQWSQKAYTVYQDRYTHGLIDYINVVNTERDWLNFQINVNTLLGYKYVAVIQLIKALGGGWSDPLDIQETESCEN